MRFPTKSISAFVLMLAGSMGFGSLYSALLNTVGVEILGIFYVLVLMPVIFIFVGFYGYNYLAYGKGSHRVALILAIIAALLAAASMLSGKAEQQKFFALHEILNLVSAWALAITLFMDMRK